MWDDYHIFLIAVLVFTRLLLDDILPPYRITIWLIDDVNCVLVCLLDNFILGFCYSNLDTGNRWTRTPIDYHPCITSEPTNKITFNCIYIIERFFFLHSCCFYNFSPPIFSWCGCGIWLAQINSKPWNMKIFFICFSQY